MIRYMNGLWLIQRDSSSASALVGGRNIPFKFVKLAERELGVPDKSAQRLLRGYVKVKNKFEARLGTTADELPDIDRPDEFFGCLETASFPFFIRPFHFLSEAFIAHVSIGRRCGTGADAPKFQGIQGEFIHPGNGPGLTCRSRAIARTKIGSSYSRYLSL